MGPSAGGLTCNLALVRLLSIISDTRSATPCPNSAVSTPAETFNVGGGDASAAALDVINCAAPAAPSFDMPVKEESGPLPRECLSAAPASAEAETAWAMDNAAAARTAAAMVADEFFAAAATAGAGAALDPKTPCGAALVSGVVKSSTGGEDCVVGALVPCASAAAMMACAAAPVSAGDEPSLGVVLPGAAVLPSLELGADVAAAMLALRAVASMGAAPSVGLAARAPDATGTRAAGAGAPAALPDKAVETGAAVAPAASGAVMENPGGMLAAPAAWLPAPCIKSSLAAAMLAGGSVPAAGVVPAGGVESAATG
jgi:trimeric autotransporter adhesin